MPGTSRISWDRQYRLRQLHNSGIMARHGFDGGIMAMPGPDRKRLWGRSGNQCAMPGCHKSLTAVISDYVDTAGTGESVTLGEEAHIVAESDNGPRANPEMQQSERDGYPNRILLCESCHKVVDAANGKYFSVETLLAMKRDHEELVERGMGASDREKQQAGELVARFIEEWESRTGIADWEGWTSYLLSPRPTMTPERFQRFSEAAVWLGSRKLPKANYPRISHGVQVFSTVWRDLVRLIDREFSPGRFSSEIELRAKHKENFWDQKIYREFIYEYEINVQVVHEIVFHASAAANLLSDLVREELDPAYGFDRGAATIVRGPDEHLRFQHFRPEYEGDQRVNKAPCPGLDELTKLAGEDLGAEYRDVVRGRQADA